MLPKKRRPSKELIKKTLIKGKNIRGQNVSLKYLAALSGLSTFTFIISAKTIKSAVSRNKLKRRGRAVISKVLPRLREGYSVLLFFKGKNHKMNFSELKEEIIKLLQEADLFKSNT